MGPTRPVTRLPGSPRGSQLMSSLPRRGEEGEDRGEAGGRAGAGVDRQGGGGLAGARAGGATVGLSVEKAKTVLALRRCSQTR